MKKIFTWFIFLTFFVLCFTELFLGLYSELDSSSSKIITREKKEGNKYE